ncbi:hypothetical protein L798_09305 [Zootermopsis nevadensis]|uniref:Uncharacterized protein n=1 Tax=Zootermopsis nevadensis TaxID=136037 RepID=A0A067R1S7_ZOONE|nr:hypothetical protein L798_09305 [Zootermopsis nevadensis]
MGHQWNDTDKEKLKDSEKNVSMCHFVHHKSNMDCPGSDLALHSGKPATNLLCYGIALLSLTQNLVFTRSSHCDILMHQVLKSIEFAKSDDSSDSDRSVHSVSVHDRSNLCLRLPYILVYA